MEPVGAAEVKVRSGENRIVDCTYWEASEALREADVAVAPQTRCTNEAEVREAIDRIAGPAAMKLTSVRGMHKRDEGAVLLGLVDREEAVIAYRALAEIAASHGVSECEVAVQAMIETDEPELFVGLHHDETFGHVVMVGAGGTLVELLDDTVLMPAPVTSERVLELVSATRLGRMLSGYRGGRDSLAAAARTVADISRLPARTPGVRALDVNPLLLGADDRWVAVDARMQVDEALPVSSPPNIDVRSSERPGPALAQLIEPESVVVIGASATNVDKIGSRVLSNLVEHGFRGALAAVHPTAETIRGVPCFPSPEMLPRDAFAMACIAVPGPSAASVLEALAGRGVRAAIVFSSGFTEAGASDDQLALAEVAARWDVALCGPNSAGIVTPGSSSFASFSQAVDHPEPRDGRVVLISQSGALGGSLASQLWSYGVGLRSFVSVGNQASLGIADYLTWAIEDERTSCVCALLEGVTDGPGLVEAATRMTDAGKPFVVMKTGRSLVGRRTVLTHTGAIAGDHRVYEAVLREAGAIQVGTLTEMVDVTRMHSAIGTRRRTRVGILSTSGGGCSVTADLCDFYGLDVPTLESAVRDELESVLPSFATVENPVDVTGAVVAEPALLSRALGAMLRSEDIDVVVTMITAIADPMARRIASVIVEAAAGSEKPVVVVWTLAAELISSGSERLESAGIPVFDESDRAVRALSKLSRRGPGDERRDAETEASKR